jgi:hypothetical protein
MLMHFVLLGLEKKLPWKLAGDEGAPEKWIANILRSRSENYL